jgi:hypothetical protein
MSALKSQGRAVELSQGTKEVVCAKDKAGAISIKNIEKKIKNLVIFVI